MRRKSVPRYPSFLRVKGTLVRLLHIGYPRDQGPRGTSRSQRVLELCPGRLCVGIWGTLKHMGMEKPEMRCPSQDARPPHFDLLWKSAWLRQRDRSCGTYRCRATLRAKCR